MNRFFVLCVLFSWSFTASCLKLANLCEEDHFEYNGLLVNSVHSFERPIRLESAYYYLALYEKCPRYAMERSDDTDTSDNASAIHTRELDDIKRDYNKFVVRIYSEHLNSRNITEARLREEIAKIENWLMRATALREGVDSWKRNCFEQSIEKPMQASKYLLEGLLPLYDLRLHELKSTESTPYRPSKAQLSRCLKEAIDQMNCGLEFGQTMVFYDKPMDEVYKQRIVSLPRYGFLISSHSSLQLFLNFVFPFNHKRFDSSEKCVKAIELPPFFQQNSPAKKTQSAGPNKL